MSKDVADSVVLTPVLNGVRVEFTLNLTDWAAVRAAGRRLGYKATVTDQRTGKKYKIYGKRCSLPNCVCDARADLCP